MLLQFVQGNPFIMATFWKKSMVLENGINPSKSIQSKSYQTKLQRPVLHRLPCNPDLSSIYFNKLGSLLIWSWSPAHHIRFEDARTHTHTPMFQPLSWSLLRFFVKFSGFGVCLCFRLLGPPQLAVALLAVLYAHKRVPNSK